MPGGPEARQEPDFGGAAWFGGLRPSPEALRPGFEQPRPGFESPLPGFEPPRSSTEPPRSSTEPPRPSFAPSVFSPIRPAPENPGARDTVVGSWPAVADEHPESRTSRSETAANLWAEVTRGGTPAGVNPNRDAPVIDPWADFPGDGSFGPGDFPSPESVPDEFAEGAENVPFRGARRIDVSSAPPAPPRRPSVTSAGGPSMDRPRRPVTGAFNKIRDSGAMRVIMDTNAMRTLMDTAAMQMLQERFSGRGRLIASVAILAWVGIAAVGVAVYLSSHGGGTPKASASSASTVTASAAGTGVAGLGGDGTAQASPRPSAHPSATKSETTDKNSAPVEVLPVASAQAFGPDGTSDGDNPAQASDVVSGNSSQPWDTKWYATANFGNDQPGTGLVLDMGKTVTVTKVTLELAAGSADVIVRVGNTAVPGTFTQIVEGTGVGGTVSLPAARPASGRYVEIWFTRLPEDAAGTFQESVYGVQVTGRA